MFSLPRFISICHPLRKSQLVTKRRCYVIMCVTSSLLLVLFATIFSVMREEDALSHKCGTLDLHYAFWVREWFWLGVSLYLGVPYVFVLTLNVCTISSLCASRRRRRQQLNTRDLRAVGQRSRTEGMFTAMLAVASAFFLLASLPAAVFYIFFQARGEQSGVQRAQWDLFHQVSYVLVDSTHTFNFFLYFLSAHKFRTLVCRPCRPEGEIDPRNSSPRVSDPLSSPLIGSSSPRGSDPSSSKCATDKKCEPEQQITKCTTESLFKQSSPTQQQLATPDTPELLTQAHNSLPLSSTRNSSPMVSECAQRAPVVSLSDL